MESYSSLASGGRSALLNAQIFGCHFGHLAVIFALAAAEMFHIGWTGNFPCFLKNPIATLPMAHSTADPHSGGPFNEAYSAGGSYLGSLVSFSSLYNWLYAVGFTSVFDIYNLVIALELLAVAFLTLGNLHLNYSGEFTRWLSLNLGRCRPSRAQGLEDLAVNAERSLRPSPASAGTVGTASNSGPRSAYAMYAAGLRTPTQSLDIKLFPIFIWPYNLQTAYFDRLAFVPLLASASLAWAAHLATLNCQSFGLRPMTARLVAAYTGDLSAFAHSPQAALTFFGGLRAESASFYLSDVVHHHAAVALVLFWGHFLSLALRAAGVRRSQNRGFRGGATSFSLQLHLSLACAFLSVQVASVSVLSSQSLTPYPYLNYDYLSFTLLTLHHASIAATLMLGSFAHAGIFLVRDAREVSGYPRILAHKAAIISHLAWAVAFLAFHTLGVYLHNDTLVAFGSGSSGRVLLCEPVFAQIVQEASGKALYGGISPEGSGLGPAIASANKALGSLVSPAGPGDLYVAHALALGLHLSTLILLKGALDGVGSKLMPDKVHVGFHYACDGPARGGTCDISAWDSVYLATFWALNTGAWAAFYFHWKHLTLWQNAAFQFDEAGAFYLLAWFRDYLWFNSGALISGYDPLGVNDLSVWAWVFLAAHLCWATGFMFLISWRGYWQELIDILLYMHLKTPLLYDLFAGGVYTPVALSIVQARFIGLIHFSVGFIFTYAAFVVGSTS
jgi:photosystem I P700 chlorophyll a apoprotein A2